MMKRTRSWRAALGATLLLASGCGLLDVSDPNSLDEADLSNAAGADQLRRGALSAFYSALSRNARSAGLLADEFRTYVQQQWILLGLVDEEYYLDRRESVKAEQMAGFAYSDLQQGRLRTSAALASIRAHSPEAVRNARAAEMFATRGFFAVVLAEDYCPGVPLHEVADGRPVLGTPLTTAALLDRAVADFDSALGLAGDSVRITDLARVGKARALLDLGDFAAAGGAAAAVGPGFVWNAEFGAGGQENDWLVFSRFGSVTVADSEGGNGLPFVSAADPRVTTDSVALMDDGVTSLYAIGKYPDRSAPIVVASKLEAQLIEAETALNQGDPNWLVILNDLRAAEVAPALAPLADPGTFAAQLDLLYRERAFWLFATDHRLGDLRRLVRVYGRDPQQVFPSGPYWLGGVYDVATALPFPASQENGMGCTSR